MIVGVDAGCLCVDDDRLKTGVFTVAVNLLKHLIPMDSSTTYVLYCFSPIDKNAWKEISTGNSNVRMKMVTPKKFWMTASLSKEMLLHPVDVFLGFGQALPYVLPKRSIVFCYDCAFERFPVAYHGTASKLSRQTRHAVTSADTVLSISNATKSDVMHFYSVPASRIDVISLGIDTKIFRPGSKITHPSPFGLSMATQGRRPLFRKEREKGDYFLYVGSLKPVKNIPRMIEAFARFRKTAKKKYELVLAGSDWWMDPEIRDTIRKYSASGYVRPVGYVERDRLPDLYANATAFISLGLQEGFGLPYLEAMACGCPVIGADTGGTPEVVGEAGIVVDPTDINGIAGAMKQVTDEKKRSDMIRRGLARAKLFRWEKSAERVSSLLHAL